MKNIVFGGCLALAVTVGLGAQAKMASPAMGGGMAAAKTYSGCLERSSDGTFALAHAMEGKKKAAAAPAKMSGHDGMMADGMAPTRLPLFAKTVDLSAHVGHQVSVTGSNDALGGMSPFAVTSIKMIAKACR